MNICSILTRIVENATITATAIAVQLNERIAADFDVQICIVQLRAAMLYLQIPSMRWRSGDLREISRKY